MITATAKERGQKIREKLRNDLKYRRKWIEKSRKGAMIVNQNHSGGAKKGKQYPLISEGLKNKWRNDAEYRKKRLKELAKNRANGLTPSEKGKRSCARENLVAQSIQNDFKVLFRPNQVCDRIGITREGELVFVEIKSPHGRIREKQKAFKNLLPATIEYRLVRSDF